ncbi:MAG: serine/threonine protein kinase, partial [Deltaproteobacteria bacterium]|nr:serine/threonine protein kinase [Deltaproteobacteria bacterium]
MDRQQVDIGSRYRVLSKLASGGMADLYVAVLRGAAGFERRTVVKFMRPELASQDECRRMFIDEARIMASLSHANVVSVLDFGEADGGYFLALEYVEGVDLRRALRQRGRLEPPLATYVAAGVLQGLAYVHDRCGPGGEPLNIVHRDVSPSNILLGRNGDVKLGDFGIAKAMLATARTEPGTLKGKLSYMSPEQASGLPVDRRSDLFSLGVVLYVALLGRLPVEADSEAALLRAICAGTPHDPLDVDPTLPAPVAAVLRRALARDRGDRFQSADEMAGALAACGVVAGGPRDVGQLVAALASAPDAQAAGAVDEVPGA